MPVTGPGHPPPPAPGATAPALSFRSFSAGYGAGEAAAVVHGVDLEVPRGQCLALLGPNGSGKTTLVRAVLGLARVVSGELDVLGTPVAALHRRGRSAPAAGALGYVPQRHTVATSVPTTVAEVVACGLLAGTTPLRRLAPGRRRAERAAVLAALEAVGLADRRGDGVGELSGGQQRRVLIARALVARPQVLLLDEPTAGVDEESQHALVEVLARLRGSGATMVIVTHELAAVEGLVDRSVRLVDGRVRSDTPHDGARAAHPAHPHTDHPADHHLDEHHDADGAAHGLRGAARPGFGALLPDPRLGTGRRG